jgi:hypothetical protein
MQNPVIKPNRPSLEGQPTFQQGVQHEKRAEQAEQHRQAVRQHSRTHAAEGSNRQIGALPKGKGRDGDYD